MSFYILLLHGRNDPAEDMADWGFTGPRLGPFETIHGTYAAHLKCYREAVEVLELRYHEDMLTHEGKFYGDFEIAST
jgi:hypothetical protein